MEPWFTGQLGVFLWEAALMLLSIAFYMLVEEQVLINRRIQFWCLPGLCSLSTLHAQPSSLQLSLQESSRSVWPTLPLGGCTKISGAGMDQPQLPRSSHWEVFSLLGRESSRRGQWWLQHSQLGESHGWGCRMGEPCTYCPCFWKKWRRMWATMLLDWPPCHAMNVTTRTWVPPSLCLARERLCSACFAWSITHPLVSTAGNWNTFFFFFTPYF